MKKALPIIIAVVAVAAILVSCIILFTGGDKGGDKTPKSIALTTENIDQYIAFHARYKNYKGLHYIHSGVLGMSCDIDFQTYAIQQGSFNNVKITVQANVRNEFDKIVEWADANPWFLVGEIGEPIQFSFQLSAIGEFSYVYAIECEGNSSDLYGDCELTIISVTGTFTPAN